jgi:hypothetical protein
VVIKLEQGEAVDADKANCLGGARSAASGAPFFVLAVMIAGVWVICTKYKYLEPDEGGEGGGEEEGEGKGGEGEGGGREREGKGKGEGGSTDGNLGA